MTRAALQAGETVVSCSPAAAASARRPIQVARAPRRTRDGDRRHPKSSSARGALGADHVHRSPRGRFSAEVAALTDGRGVDVVVEHVGQATWGEQRAIARARRTARHLRRDDRADAAIDLRHLFARQLSLLGSYMGRFAELQQAAELLFDGTFRPVIDTVLPLAEAAEAQRRLEGRAQFGKIVLDV